MRISVRGYHDILKDIGVNFYLKVFSGVLSQAKRFFEIIQTESNDISSCSKKRGRISDFFNRDAQQC
jgi:hypothetical protein